MGTTRGSGAGAGGALPLVTRMVTESQTADKNPWSPRGAGGPNSEDVVTRSRLLDLTTLLDGSGLYGLLPSAAAPVDCRSVAYTAPRRIPPRQTGRDGFGGGETSYV